MNDYIIIDDTIIFYPDFNNSLSNYMDIVCKYNKLIFSNYDDPLICIETNNESNEKYYYCNYKSNKFNQIVDWTSSNLTHLTFGWHFNQIVNLTPNITHLTFGWHFNQLIDLPQNLTHLTFGGNFNQIVNLPSELTHLTFGNNFNQLVILPPNLTYLTFGSMFNQLINLTPNLTHLTFGRNFQQLVNWTPQNLTHLTFGRDYNQLVNWTPNLTHLTYGLKFNQSVNLPHNLTHLTFGDYFNQQINIPSSIKYLTFGKNFNQQINIPSSIKYLKLQSDNQYILDNLPNGIEELELTNVVNLELTNLELTNLPSGIKKILLYDDNIFSRHRKYNKELNCLPKSIEYIRLNYFYDKKISNIPANLKILECSKNYNFIDDFVGKYEIIKY
jgi:hypothetical protein